MAGFTAARLIKSYLLALVLCIVGQMAHAASSGLDTPTGVTDLPFSVQGVQVMDLTSTGLAIGRAQDGGWALEVAGTGNQHGIYGQAGSANYWGVGGYSNNGSSYGGLGVANNYGAYGISSGGQGVYGQSTSSYGVYGVSTNSWAGVFTGAAGVLGEITGGAANWAGEFVGNNTAGSGGVLAYSGASNWAGEFLGGSYGVYGQGSSWAGYFAGPVAITSGYLQFPDGTQQTTAASGHQYGGQYTIDNTCNGQICQGPNPFTGGCSCPGGYSSSGAQLTGQSTCQNYYSVFCYKY